MRMKHLYITEELKPGDGLLTYTPTPSHPYIRGTFTLYQVRKTDGVTATARRVTRTKEQPRTIKVRLENNRLTITYPETLSTVPVIHVGEQCDLADSPFEETFFTTSGEDDRLTAVHVTHSYTDGVGYVGTPFEKLVVTDEAAETILNYLQDQHQLTIGITSTLYRDALTVEETYNAFPPVATEALQEFISYPHHDTISELLQRAHYNVTPEQWADPTVEYAWESIYNADDRLVDSAQIDDITWWHDDEKMVDVTVRYLNGKLAALNLIGDVGITDNEIQAVNEYTALLNRLIARLQESGLY